MRRGTTLWLVAIVVITAICLGLVIPEEVQLGERTIKVVFGLDIQGGVRVLMSAQQAEGVTPEQMEAVRRVIDRRVNALGVAEPIVQVAGSNRIQVELPGIQNREAAVNLIQETALLEFVDFAAIGGCTINVPDGAYITTDRQLAIRGGAATEPTPSATGTAESTAAATAEGTATVEATGETTGMPEATGTPEPTGTAEPTSAATETPEAANTVEATGTPDATVEATAARQSNSLAQGTPQPSATPEATASATVEPTGTPEATPTAEATADATSTTEATGTAEPTAESTAEGTPDPAATAEATPSATPEANAPGSKANPLLNPCTGQPFKTVMTGAGLRNATSRIGGAAGNQYVVAFELVPGNAEAQAFAAHTGANIGQPLAIVLDGELLSAPTIQARLDTGGEITGGFDQEQSRELAVQLRSGALPVSLEIESQEAIGASLGAESVTQAVRAGVLGLLTILIFLIIYYRVGGIAASLALLLFALINFALYKYIPVVLTLSAITGFLISIGSAIDGNILIFERIKEELRAGRNVNKAVELGFARAWATIRDSNISTIIIALILYFFGGQFGASAVRGFAITLIIGLFLNLFTAVVVTHVVLTFILYLGGERLQKTNLFGSGKIAS